MDNVSRREFIQGAATATVATGVLGTSRSAWAGANDRVRMCVMGIRGRGREHIEQWNRLDNVEIATLCDIDENLFGETIQKYFSGENAKRPAVETDIRRVIEDKNIDAISIATPNHWHSLAAIWAMEAGKDVYVEKPCSHNVWEGRQLVNAARRYNRIAQHGTQSRSSRSIQEAMAHLRNGAIGEVYLARGLCYKPRGDIGRKQDAAVPQGVHYDTWLGPAPERAFSDNRFHYNWHWHWDYGNGDIGNQGVHQMDIARWGLSVTLPSRVSGMGGKYLFDDDKETPNVITTEFSYPDAGPMGKMLQFEVRHWLTNDEKNAKIGNLFYGSEGYIVIDTGSRYQIYLGQKEEKGPGGDSGGDHFGNFIDAVRARDRSALTAEIEEGHYSSALCHLGLVSARLGRSFQFDPKTEQVVGDDDANAMMTRAYREPFVVPAVTV